MTPVATTADSRIARRRKRFARTWAGLDEATDNQVRPAKEELLPDCPPNLVEVGPGLGSSFSYYQMGTRVLAFEPNPWFHDGLKEKAAEHEIDLDLQGESFTAGSLDAEAHDCVVSCLTLCSVEDRAGALTEIYRGLRPGGRLVFIEHVAARTGIKAMYQKVIRSPWRWLGDGCDPRSTFLLDLENSPFQVETLKVERLGSDLDPTNLVAWGTARKAGPGE